MRYTKEEINKAEKRKQMLAQKRKKNMTIAFSVVVVFLVCIGLYIVASLPKIQQQLKTQ